MRAFGVGAHAAIEAIASGSVASAAAADASASGSCVQPEAGGGGAGTGASDVEGAEGAEGWVAWPSLLAHGEEEEVYVVVEYDMRTDVWSEPTGDWSAVR
jgi:hypothetical protein